MKPIRVLLIDHEGFSKTVLAMFHDLMADFDIEHRRLLGSEEDFDVYVLRVIDDSEKATIGSQVNKLLILGKGVMCIHDAWIPLRFTPNKDLLDLLGIRHSNDSYLPKGTELQLKIALADRSDPTMKAPVIPNPRWKDHPVLLGIGEFELADELWPTNTSSDVKNLLLASTDSFPSSKGFPNNVSIFGCREVHSGRVCFLVPGHYEETFHSTSIVGIIENAIYWLARQEEILRKYFEDTHETDQPGMESVDAAKGVSDLQRRILDAVWSSFLDSGKWPRCSDIKAKSGSPRAVDSNMVELPKTILSTQSSGSHEIYRLGLLGILVTSQGSKTEGLVASFLCLLKEKITSKQSVEFRIPKKTVVKKLGLTDRDDIDILIRVLQASDQRWGTFEGGDPKWFFKPSDQAVELMDVDATSIREYIWNVAAQEYPASSDTDDSSEDKPMLETPPGSKKIQLITTGILALLVFILTTLQWVFPDLVEEIFPSLSESERGDAKLLFAAVSVLLLVVVIVVLVRILFFKRIKEPDPQKLRKGLVWRKRIVKVIAIVIPIVLMVILAHSLLQGTLVNKLSSAEPEIPAMMEFVHIAGGFYQMGTHDAGIGHNPSTTTRPVLYIHAFEILRTEVTQGMWREVTGIAFEDYVDSRNHPEGSIGTIGDSIPVHRISYVECREFLLALNELDSTHVYRLPSEAEWEYASRYSETYTGDSANWSLLLDSIAWFVSNQDENVGPYRVAQKEPNLFELYDMYGNVSEWCEDSYHPDYLGMPLTGSPWLDTGPEYIRRGGGYKDQPCVCTSTFRGRQRSNNAYSTLGFRVVRIARDD